MNKTLLKKVGLITGITGLVCLLLLLGFRIRLKLALDLVSVPVASHDLPPRTRVMSDDILELQIPSAYLQEYAYRNTQEIIGLYTDIQGKIPAGSLFYKGMLVKEADLPDYPSAQLKSGQSAYTLQVDLTTIGGTVVAGQRVDLFVSLEPKNEPVMTGRLFENVRIVAIKDHKGVDLFDESSTGVPYLAILAINSSDVELLSLAEQIGSIRLFSTDATYNNRKEATLCEGAILDYLRQNHTVG